MAVNLHFHCHIFKLKLKEVKENDKTVCVFKYEEDKVVSKTIRQFYKVEIAISLLVV